MQGIPQARPLLQQICGRAFFQELNSAHKYKQPGHRVVSLLTLTSLLCLHVCRRQAGAGARWCGHSPLLCAAAALRGQKTAASLAAVFKCRSQLAGAHDSSQLTHAAADRTRTMPPESRGQCTVHKNQTVHEQLNSSRQLGKPMHAPTQGVLNFYTYVPTVCTQYAHSSLFFSIELQQGDSYVAGPT